MTNRVRTSCNNLLSVTDLTSLSFCHPMAAARRYIYLYLEIFVVDAATFVFVVQVKMFEP